MDKLNYYLNAIKNSKPVKYFIEKTETTFNTVKSNSVYKIVLMALIVDILLIPFNTGLKILEKLLGGFFDIGSYMGASAFDMIENIYYMFIYSSPSTMEIAQIVGFFVVSSIVTIVGFLLVNFYLPNGALNSFTIYVTEGRVVKFKEFFKLTKLNIKRYFKTLITVVAIPLLLIKIAGTLINYVPFVAGISFSNLVIKIVKYALLFKMYAILLGINGEEEMQNKASDWLTYAIFMYILERVTTFGLVIKAFNIIFILFTILSINSEFKNINLNIDSNNNSDKDENNGENYTYDNNCDNNYNTTNSDVNFDKNVNTNNNIYNNKLDIKKDVNTNSINEYNNISISKVEETNYTQQEDAYNNSVINSRMNILKESKPVIEDNILPIEEDIIPIKEEDILYTENTNISNNSSKSGISLGGSVSNYSSNSSSNTIKSGLNLNSLSSSSNNINLNANTINTINNTNSINNISNESSSVEDCFKIDDNFLDEDFIFRFDDFDK